MKQLTFFILSLFSICSTKSQDLSKIIYPDRFENSKSCLIKNNIATETIYEFTSLKKNSDSVKAEIITYDKEGKIINCQTFSNNMLSMKESYVYNPDKKIHQIIKDFYSPKDYRVFEYEYDSLGNEIREYIYTRDTTNLIVNAKIYNSKNQILEYYTKRNNDSFKLQKTYSYNEADILTKIEVHNLNGKVTSTYSYIVDTNNNYKTAYYQRLEDKNQKEEFVFDNSNRCIKVNGNATQPINYTNDDNSVYKSEIRIIPRTEEFEYYNDDTMFLMVEKVDRKITKVRKHYYTKH